jgi:hypothetical protein
MTCHTVEISFSIVGRFEMEFGFKVVKSTQKVLSYNDIVAIAGY